MKLIAMRGLPASGKTTEARGWVKIDPAKRARSQVVRMWRSLGLTVFQVAEGNY